MKKILFPTDFSDNSMKAMPYALDVARLLNGELTLFNAYQMPYSKANLLVSILDRMKKDSEDELNELKRKSIENPIYKSLEIQIEARRGGLLSQIPKVAHDFQSDLIVMGTKGGDSLKEVVIGSNTVEVIQSTKCPVMVIPENAQNAKVSKIAMATDLNKINNYEQLIPLIDMAKICNASIEFVNIVRPEDKKSSEEISFQVKKLLDFVKEVPTSMHFATNNDIIAGLAEYTNNRSPGMLAMLSRKHSLFERLFLQSMTKRLSFRSEIPLLVMNE